MHKLGSLTIRFWAPTLGVVLLVSAGGVAALQGQTQDKIVATVNGRGISQKEVDDSIAPQLLPLEQQVYALRKAALENLISRAVLEDAARKKGVTLDELKKQLTLGKVEINPSQVEAMYAENALAFGAMSPDEAKERLRLDLESQARMKFYRDSVAELRKNSTIESRLDEPRLPAVISDISAAPSIGPGNASVTIIEFSDFQCPFCRGAQSTLKQVLKDHANDVRLVFKHLPLEMHANAFAAAQSAFCAGEQGQFWKYQDALFVSESLSSDALEKTALTLGLDGVKFRACVKSEAGRTAILKDLDEARRLGINSTPTFIINGRLYQGMPSVEGFKAVITRELKIAQNTSSKQP